MDPKQNPANTIDCACVIHGNVYDWIYVENLYRMICRNLSYPVRFHVWTEASRHVPSHMVRHDLQEWPNISGAKKSWWYKMQMFNSDHYQGRLLYFDLDVVIVRNIDWILYSNPTMFWAIHDFRRLWRSSWNGINSSVMYWDTVKFDWIWKAFNEKNVAKSIAGFAGDQDYLSSVLDEKSRGFFPNDHIQSWRWEVNDGGLELPSRRYRQPGAGAVLAPSTSIVVFHGQPKPHEVSDPLILDHWHKR